MIESKVLTTFWNNNLNLMKRYLYISIRFVVIIKYKKTSICFTTTFLLMWNSLKSAIYYSNLTLLINEILWSSNSVWQEWRCHIKIRERCSRCVDTTKRSSIGIVYIRFFLFWNWVRIVWRINLINIGKWWRIKRRRKLRDVSTQY